MKTSRRIILGGGAAALASLVLVPIALTPAKAGLPPVTVWKSPTCGCCSKWVEHMQAAGFDVTVHDVEAINKVKADKGISLDVASCHTAAVGGYVLEGHVPADAVKRLLRERPTAKGLAVPGMPVGSPGMETGATEPYDVLLLTETGTSLFERR